MPSLSRHRRGGGTYEVALGGLGELQLGGISRGRICGRGSAGIEQGGYEEDKRAGGRRRGGGLRILERGGRHNETSGSGGGSSVLLTRRQRVAEDSVDTTVFSHLVCSTGCPAKKGFGGDYPGRLVVVCEGALVVESGGWCGWWDVMRGRERRGMEVLYEIGMASDGRSVCGDVTAFVIVPASMLGTAVLVDGLDGGDGED